MEMSPSRRRRIVVRCALIAAAFGLIAAWFTPGGLRVYHPVDPAKVCFDNSGEVYTGAYNLSPDKENPDPFKWQCYKEKEGDLTETEGSLNIEMWCKEHRGTRHTTVRDDVWHCVEYRGPF